MVATLEAAPSANPLTNKQKQVPAQAGNARE